MRNGTLADTFVGNMSEDHDEEAPLLDSFEEVFPPTPSPNADVFDKIEQNQPVITSALAGLLPLNNPKCLRAARTFRGVAAMCFPELRTTATGLKAGVGWTFMKRFARLWRMGFGSWCSRMVRCCCAQSKRGFGLLLVNE